MSRAVALGLTLLVACAVGQEPQGSDKIENKEKGASSRPSSIHRISDLEEGDGFSALYPGDQNIGKDSRTVFSEDFEGRDPFAAWSDCKSADCVRLVENAPHSGYFALAIDADTKTNQGGHLFKRLQYGQNTLYVRFYVKFAAPAEYVQHFVQISADEPARHFPFGGAGVCPDGGARFATAIEPFGAGGAVAPPGAWHLHSYWCEMAIAGDGKYWGNDFEPLEAIPVISDRWICVEVMVRANSTPTANDGAQAFWIDGKLAAAFEGYRWRTDRKLKLNGICLQYSMTEEAARRQGSPEPLQTARVLFDDLVVATRYIGPQAPLPMPTQGTR
jgi:hypothetical protein